MYKNSLQQLEFENFYLPFGGKLDGNNRWVKLRAMIPWHEFESMYLTIFGRAFKKTRWLIITQPYPCDWHG